MSESIVALLDDNGEVVNIIVCDHDKTDLIGTIVKEHPVATHFRPITKKTGAASIGMTNSVDGFLQPNEVVEVKTAVVAIREQIKLDAAASIDQQKDPIQPLTK